MRNRLDSQQVWHVLWLAAWTRRVREPHGSHWLILTQSLCANSFPRARKSRLVKLAHHRSSSLIRRIDYRQTHFLSIRCQLIKILVEQLLEGKEPSANTDLNLITFSYDHLEPFRIEHIHTFSFPRQQRNNIHLIGLLIDKLGDADIDLILPERNVHLMLRHELLLPIARLCH